MGQRKHPRETTSGQLEDCADAMAIVRELVEDVKLAHGTGKGDTIDEESLNWFDLAVTYRKAVELLRRSRGV